MAKGIARFLTVTKRYHLGACLGLVLTISAVGAAVAEPGTPAQRKACTPDVYRLCAGEIPNVRAITSCLRRQKWSLSEPAGRCSTQPAVDVGAGRLLGWS